MICVFGKYKFSNILIAYCCALCVGWRVGVWLSSLEMIGLRKLRPRVELQRPQGRKVRALATEQKRNVRPARDDDAR